jgi:DNA-binding IclR family transcriptional regulator
LVEAELVEDHQEAEVVAMAAAVVDSEGAYAFALGVYVVILRIPNRI